MNRPEQIAATIKNVAKTKQAIRKGYAPCANCGKNVVLGQYHLHKRSGDCK